MLAATQLPALAAILLVMGSDTSEHELQVATADGRVTVTLHHVQSPRAGHHHTALESFFIRTSDQEHPDHSVAFGTSDATSKSEPADGLPDSTSEVVAEWHHVCSDDGRTMPVISDLSLERPPEHSPPGSSGWQRLGTVMRL